MRILQVSTQDIGGGAEKVAWKLHHDFRSRGHHAVLAVGRKISDLNEVFEIDNSKRHRGLGLLRVAMEHILGHQYEYLPGSHEIPSLVGTGWDVIHLHNLHGKYFDLAALGSLSEIAPTIVSMQDMWLMTGHCAHPLDSDRWRVGCGSCPHLDTYPRIFRDGTAHNLRRKKAIFDGVEVAISSAAKWLLDLVGESYLSRFPRRRILNPVDLEIFQPGDQAAERERLGLPVDRPVLFYPLDITKENPFKDHNTFLESMRLLSDVRLVAVAFGKNRDASWPPNLDIRPPVSDEAEMASYYRAADVTLHPSRADTFPLAVIESMACGTPVVGTRVGGIPEIINEGVTGLLVDPEDPRGLAESIRILIGDESKVQAMRKKSAQEARRYDLRLVVDDWLAWYEELIEARKVAATRR